MRKSLNFPQGEDFAEPEEPSDENEEPETEDDEEEYSDNEYADEFLSLEDLLVCVVTENLYILIWEKPYYILDRHGFEDEKRRRVQTVHRRKSENHRGVDTGCVKNK